MNLANKHAVQRRLKAAQYSGHALVDDSISTFTIFPAYIDELRVSMTERTALQKQATVALEPKVFRTSLCRPQTSFPDVKQH